MEVREVGMEGGGGGCEGVCGGVLGRGRSWVVEEQGRGVEEREGGGILAG